MSGSCLGTVVVGMVLAVAPPGIAPRIAPPGIAPAVVAPPLPDGKPKKGEKPKPAAAIVEGAIGRKLDEAMLETDRDVGGFCGVVIVAARGKVLLEKGYGVADAAASKPMPVDALYDWASVSKQFTAAAMLRLIDASRLDKAGLKKVGAAKLAGELDKKWKKLSLDDPLSRFFPDAPKDKAGVTIRQLLNHTSGMEAGFKAEWRFDSRSRDSFVECVLSRPMVSKPGDKWEYSNSGYALVAAIVEVVTGDTFEEFCAEHLFAPAGMSSATMIGRPDLELARVPKIARGTGFPDLPAGTAFAYGNQLNWGYRGCGGIVATAHDFFAWDRALRGDALLSKESIAALYEPALRDYALGWEVRKEGGGTIVSHSGGVRGVVAYCVRHLDDDWVVALACSYEPKEHPAQIGARLARIVGAPAR